MCSYRAMLRTRVGLVSLTPPLPQPVKFPGWKMQRRACKQFIFRSCNTSTFSAMRFDQSSFPMLVRKRKKKTERVTGFKFRIFGLNKTYSFIVSIGSTNKYRKHKSSMLIWVLPIDKMIITQTFTMTRWQIVVKKSEAMQYAYLSVTYGQHDNYTDTDDGKMANCCQKVSGNGLFVLHTYGPLDLQWRELDYWLFAH